LAGSKTPKSNAKPKKCKGTTKSGKPCRRNALKGKDFCKSHGPERGEQDSTNSTPLKGRKKPKWADAFLASFRAKGTVSAACKMVGKDRKTAYNLKRECEEFSDQWDEINEAVTDDLESTLIERALRGWKEPVYYKGKLIGAKIRHDNTLAWNLLRARRASKYNLASGEKNESTNDVQDAATKIITAIQEIDDCIEGPPK
jgi:hypothetical protein